MESADSNARGPARRWSLPLLAAAALGVALVHYGELLRRPFGTGFGDYQFFHHNWEFGRVAWSRFGELPLFNPYYCGGIPDFGDPQSQIHHPLFFVSFLTGTTIALKLFVVLHAAAGFLGMYLYARRLVGLGAMGAALAALAWAGSGFFAWHCGTGHGGFVAFFLLPWLLLAWNRSFADVRYAAGVALVLTLALLAGGAYVFPFMLLLLALDGVPRLFARDQREGVLTAAALAGVLTLLLGAWRLIPILQHLREFPRTREIVDRLGPGDLLRSLTHNPPFAGWVVPEHPYSVAEYGMYVGWGVVLLASAGALLVLVRERRHATLVVGALAFGALTLGEFSRYSPWSLLKKLPVYGSLQAPTRFSVTFLFFVALLAGLALDRALAWIERSGRARLARLPARAWPLAGVLTLAALAAPIVLEHHEVLHERWREPAVPRGAVAPRFHLGFVPDPKNPVAMMPPNPQFPGQNRGTGYCYTGMGYQASGALWAGDVPQVLVPRGATLHEFGRTTRRVWADVELPGGGRVIFNQTHTPGWRSSFGPPTSDHRRAAYDLPPGRHRLALRYEPASLWWGALGSLAGVVAALLFTRNRLASLATATATRTIGVAAAGAVLATVLYGRGVLAAEPAVVSPMKAKLSASASAYAESALNQSHAPDKAVDGNSFTEWLAPNSEKAWLDVALDAPLELSTVAILNARNLPYRDRATLEFRIEAFSGGNVVGGGGGRFSHPSGEPEWAHVSFPKARADRIRVTIESWSGLGGGIGEVRVY